MTTTMKKWGNSLGVRIPQRIAQQYGVHDGSKIEVSIREHGIILKAVEKDPTLEELLAKCTPEKRHEEIDFGRAGKELF